MDSDHPVDVRHENYTGSRRVIVTGLTLQSVDAAAQGIVDTAPPEADAERFPTQFDATTGGYRTVVWLRTGPSG
ncbi:hypothetical protein [Paraburkholderia adhaesiva]|uniref:hypothetical protein n=1 Tax=Paraburkholderia adhaesiva TaxID=2883244 RepID=UPI001F222194|nr:hypothetical protein [Paraburkholderia adhaesiva]